MFIRWASDVQNCVQAVCIIVLFGWSWQWWSKLSSLFHYMSMLWWIWHNSKWYCSLLVLIYMSVSLSSECILYFQHLPGGSAHVKEIDTSYLLKWFTTICLCVYLLYLIVRNKKRQKFFEILDIFLQVLNQFQKGLWYTHKHLLYTAF